ncbi:MULTISPECIES: ParA family protein [Shinella]|uniref:AAA family ATPase n=1 Tax=Shinella zoogloeoides TaxID=352475 RepID=A0A6N8TEZ1_SHIZO|nr:MULTISPECIES: ParA family protein [Shinella]EYR79583.1 ATPases involved in chromosome partitioning [Shinella sp. DD12]EYR79592.1 putative ParA-like protein [Shinella sp. DD12]MCW5712038.1 ParA family protein [Shinella sp.]MXO01837.1 AAA family ATPase [Shinella zoogloeoides]TAA50521.1 ParA family protein [Shinella sp. JR1-6]
MIVTIANPKGGTGKTTLVRALSGTAAHAGNDVFLIDADSRANTMRWVTMSKQMNVWPDRLEAESCLDPNQIYKLALQRQYEGKVVFIDIEGTTNENLFAGLYCADIVLIPLQTTQDDVVAGMQLALNHIPVVEEDQKRKLPTMIVINQHDLVTGRAKAHEPLREILRESGVTVAPQPIARRAAYQSIGAAGTLQTVAKSDPKAIAEMETLLSELLTLYKNSKAEART